MLRFLVVGAVNTVFGMAIMFGCYNLAGCSYEFSTAANVVLASILSYILNRCFTFRSTDRSVAQAVRFAINIALCYLVAYGVAKPLAHAVLAGLSEVARDNVAMLVGMCFFTPLNYVGQRFFVFKKGKRSG